MTGTRRGWEKESRDEGGGEDEEGEAPLSVLQSSVAP